MNDLLFLIGIVLMFVGAGLIIYSQYLYQKNHNAQMKRLNEIEEHFK
jgi:high-affinity Fe2+/Pb2+ permease